MYVLYTYMEPQAFGPMQPEPKASNTTPNHHNPPRLRTQMKNRSVAPQFVASTAAPLPLGWPSKASEPNKRRCKMPKIPG